MGLEEHWGTLGIIEMFLWLADVSVCGNSEVQLSPVVSQHRRIALLSMKLTIVFTYSPVTSHHPPVPTTQDNSTQISTFFTGGFVRKSLPVRASEGQWVNTQSVYLSLITRYWAVMWAGPVISLPGWRAGGLSLLIVFAGGIWSVWRVVVVVVSTQTNDEDLKIAVNKYNGDWVWWG